MLWDITVLDALHILKQRVLGISVYYITPSPFPVVIVLFLQALEQEQRVHADLKNKFQRLSLNFAETKQLVKTGDYKVENFDRIQRCAA